MGKPRNGLQHLQRVFGWVKLYMPQCWRHFWHWTLISIRWHRSIMISGSLIYVPWKKRTWTRKYLGNYFLCNLNSLSLTWQPGPTALLGPGVVLLFIGLLLCYQVVAMWSSSHSLRLVFVGLLLGSVLHVATWALQFLYHALWAVHSSC